jgi:hypothetical protein
VYFFSYYSHFSLLSLYIFPHITEYDCFILYSTVTLLKLERDLSGIQQWLNIRQNGYKYADINPLVGLDHVAGRELDVAIFGLLPQETVQTAGHGQGHAVKTYARIKRLDRFL